MMYYNIRNKEKYIHGGMSDEEDIPEMWDGLDIVGDYRMDFAL